MTDLSWEEAMTRLTAAQRDFVNGDATGIKRHADPLLQKQVSS